MQPAASKIKENVNAGYLYIIAAAALWSSVGPARKVLYDAGAASMVSNFWRALLALVIATTYLLIRDRKLFRISAKDIPFFMFFALLGVTIFYYLYFMTIDLMSMAAAVVLLYTAPAFTFVLAYFLLKEPITWKKLLCVGITFMGAFLVVEGYNLEALRLSGPGILVGLAAGLNYAGYTIFCKKAVVKHHPMTVVFYTLLFGCLFMAVLLIPSGYQVSLTPQTGWAFLYMAIFTTILPHVFYNMGLATVESGRASVVASIEIVFATLLGIFILQEKTTLIQGLGVALVLLAAYLIQEKRSPVCIEESKPIQ